MALKFVKSKGVHCPNCGKSRNVALWRELMEAFTNERENVYWYYIRCSHCKRRWMITDMGADDY